jgi:prolyl-tRNA editing enzyme YbaK/EbsC (Cys-tRNA(Pro) deacylase)
MDDRAPDLANHDPAGRDWLVRHLEPLGVDYELFACDPALADTAAFCAAYGFDPEDSANTIVVIGKSDPPRYAACVTLAPYRLDVNRTSATGSERERPRSHRPRTRRRSPGCRSAA